MKKRFATTLILVILSLIAVYGVSYVALGRILHPVFYRVSERVQKIPGAAEGFVPQGVTAIPDGRILVSAYSSGPSRIYILDGNGGTSYISLATEDGSPYKGHAGGITASGDYIYISNASRIFVLSLSDLLSSSSGDTVSFVSSFPVPCRASFCSSDGEYLYVGEYHAPGYSTEESHTISSSDGIHKAMVFAYRLSDSGKAETEPSLAFSVRDKVQGFALFDSKVALSCSSGLNPSLIAIYDASVFDGVYSIEGRDIPLMVLDSNKLIASFSAPHMSEDLEYRDDRLLVAFEAGSTPYGLGLIPSSLHSVMAMDLSIL